jgi:hypothetical protein
MTAIEVGRVLPNTVDKTSKGDRDRSGCHWGATARIGGE